MSSEKQEVNSLGRFADYDSNVQWNLYIDNIDFHFPVNNIQKDAKN